MSKFSKPGFICLSLIFFAIVSFKVFSPLENTDLANKKNWIPKDFDPAKVTLLIQKHAFREKDNVGMAKFIEKEYPWKYEIVSLEDIQGVTKYQDKKLYQFALMWSDFKTSPQIGTHFVNHDLEGHFLDRSNDKEYPESGYALNRGNTAYRKIITVLVNKFKGIKDDKDDKDEKDSIK